MGKEKEEKDEGGREFRIFPISSFILSPFLHSSSLYSSSFPHSTAA